MAVVKFDPNTKDTQANAHGKVGWKGSYPSTPCRNCGNEFFTWIGDWGMGYRCGRCGQRWVEA